MLLTLLRFDGDRLAAARLGLGQLDAQNAVLVLGFDLVFLDIPFLYIRFDISDDSG